MVESGANAKYVPDRWEFVEVSGSVYVCRKDACSMSSYMAGIPEGWEEAAKEDFVFKVPGKYCLKVCQAAEGQAANCGVGGSGRCSLATLTPLRRRLGTVHFYW